MSPAGRTETFNVLLVLGRQLLSWSTSLQLNHSVHTAPPVVECISPAAAVNYVTPATVDGFYRDDRERGLGHHAEPLVRAGHLLTDGISASRWSAERARH